jgi:uncharacterized membrane protein YfcA
MPLPLAAGTSVAAVVLTAAAAAAVQFSELAASAGPGGAAAVVPWELVGFTVPGVLIGGQLAPLLAGRAPDRVIRGAAAAVFGVVGLAFAVKAAGDL